MRVPRDDDRDTLPRRIEVQIFDIVQHVDRPIGQHQGRPVGERARPWLRVDVAPDRGGRCDRPQARHDLGATDVARVDNVVDTGEPLLRLGAQQPMRVRDDADPHRAIEHRNASRRERIRAGRQEKSSP